MAEVYQMKYKNKDGSYALSQNYYFKGVVDGKRKNINTHCANKRDAERFVKKWEGNTADDTEKLDLLSSASRFTVSGSVVELIRETGWMEPARNPKFLKAKVEEKNYGLVQAKKIASAFQHMFDKMDYFTEWETFIRRNNILKTANISYYEKFVNTNVKELTKEDAIHFIIFLKEYTDWEKKVHLEANSKHFLCQHKINLVALKSFFTYSVEINLLSNNIFHKIRIPSNVKEEHKNFFEMEQLKVLFNDDFARYIDEEFYNSSHFRALKFAALTGMRSGEVRALRFRQFNKKNPHILVVDSAFKENVIKKESIDKPKWEKVRTIYLCTSAMECVGEIGRDNEFVFATKKGTAIGAGRYIKELEKYLDKAERAYLNNFKKSLLNNMKYTPHSFRGTLNSYLLSISTVGEHLIQEYFGWTKKALTPVQRKYYTAYNDNEAFKIAKYIELGFSGRTMELPKIEDQKEGIGLLDMMNTLLRDKPPIGGFNKDTVGEFGTFKHAELVYPTFDADIEK